MTKRNPIAKSLRSPEYQQKIVPDKRRPMSLEVEALAYAPMRVKIDASFRSPANTQALTAPDCEISVATTSHEPDPDAIT